MSVEVVFETHSLTTDNEAGLATGWLDGHLSEAGKRLAVELGKRRRDESFAALFTSDLRRATETAHIAFGDSGIPIYEDGRLRECNYGLLNGMSVERLQRERLGHIEEPWPEGESYRQVVDRVEAFLEDLSARWSDARVLVIGHSATRWALDCSLNGVPLERSVESPFRWQEGWVYKLGTD